MTRFFSFIIAGLALVCFLGCPGSADRNSNPGHDMVRDTVNCSILDFSHVSHDFGEILEGETVSCTFLYTNSGNSDLVIQSASASCGCTVPRFSTGPLKPGEQDRIEVVFDSSGRSGRQTKTVTVLSNARNNPVHLIITCEIKKVAQ